MQRSSAATGSRGPGARPAPAAAAPPPATASGRRSPGPRPPAPSAPPRERREEKLPLPHPPPCGAPPTTALLVSRDTEAAGARADGDPPATQPQCLELPEEGARQAGRQGAGGGGGGEGGGGGLRAAESRSCEMLQAQLPAGGG